MKYSLLFLLLLCACSKNDTSDPPGYHGSSFYMVIDSDTIRYEGAGNLTIIHDNMGYYASGKFFTNDNSSLETSMPLEITVANVQSMTVGGKYPVDVSLHYKGALLTDANRGDAIITLLSQSGASADFSISGVLSGRTIDTSFIKGVRFDKE